MLPQTRYLSPHTFLSIFPISHFSKTICTPTTHPATLPIGITHLDASKRNPFFRSSFKRIKSSISEVSEPIKKELQKRPSPAEISRTIMELSSVGTLCTFNQEGWPLSFGVHFAVDLEGTPILCLNAANRQFSTDRKSSLHVQLEQSGSRTPQCTLQGSLDKPKDRTVLKMLNSMWKRRFGEEPDEDLMYVVSVEQVLQMEDFEEDGIWITSSEYKNANPDPLGDIAEKIVNEINTNYMDEVHRICNIYVDSEFQVKEARMIWVDRLGFDVHLSSPRKDIFEVRIPFPREVIDEKGVKSAFNCMSQHAWEVEKNYSAPEYEKVKLLKQISSGP